MNRRWKIALAALVVVLVLAVVAVGVVAADEPEETGRAGRPLRPRRGPGAGVGFAGLRKVTELLEMTPRELLQALGDGNSIADLAGDKDMAIGDIVDAMVAQSEACNAELVEREFLTGEQAGARSAQARQRALDMVTLPLPYGLQGDALRAAAEAIDISVEDLIAEIESGKTIAEVAGSEEKAAEVVEALVAAKEDSLQEMVDLDLMTETQAKLALYRYRPVAERFVANGYQCPPPSRRFVRGIASAAVRGQGLQGRRFKFAGSFQTPRFSFGR